MDTEPGRSWRSYGWGVVQQLHKGWVCFDKWAGWLIGLDNSKYQWAVTEYHLQQRELDREGTRRVDAENAVQQQMEEGLDPAHARQQAGTAADAQLQRLEMTHPQANAIVR